MNEETLSCADKLAFDSEAAATASATALAWQHGSKLRPYQCQECGLWHLTSNVTGQ